MTLQFSLLSYDLALIVVMCLSLAVAAVLIGIRIGTQHLAVPIVAKEKALAQLSEDHLHHLKAQYVEEYHVWQRATITALLLALVAGSIYLAWVHFGATENGMTSFLLALVMMLFLVSICSAGYRWGARIGMVRSFNNASAREMVELHNRLTKHPLPSNVTDMATQLPKHKCVIHLMVVHYAISTASKGVQREHA